MFRIGLLRACSKPLKSMSAVRKFNALCKDRPFSTTSTLLGYKDTLPNLKIGAHTKVLYQGFTGRHASINAQESIDFGTHVVGGVKPGIEGEHLGLPVMPSVRAAAEKLKPDASAVYVPGAATAAAIEEAIESEIPLVVAVAEHIPVHDMIRLHQILQTQSKTRLVGANCPGIMNVHGRCRIGFQPLPFFKAGNIGIAAKSGTLGYEAIASTTRAGLGQTLAISMGGDILAGTTFVEAFDIFEHDEKTEGIIMVGEVGGTTELDAVEWIKDYHMRVSNPKPIMALIAGIEAPRGRIMGHAGSWAGSGEPASIHKIKILQDIGVTVVNHPEDFGDGMKKLLGPSSSPKAASERESLQRQEFHSMQQKRGFHHMRQRPIMPVRTFHAQSQRRTLYIKEEHAFMLLKQNSIKISELPVSSKEYLIAATIDRTARQPCITASPTPNASGDFDLTAKKFPYIYKSNDATSDAMLDNVSKHLGIGGKSKEQLKKLISALVTIFMGKEGYLIETKFSLTESGNVEVHHAKFGFDDAAWKTARRQKDVHILRDVDAENWSEVEAEKGGMIYVHLEGEGTLGTLVNGAGLAMNTVDNLVRLGGHPANFLDTGGAATADTVKLAFRCITADHRVKAIFVNIFGGLIDTRIIAKGVITAFEEQGIQMPIIVRLRGSYEAEGQKMISDSGLKLEAFDDFAAAADRAIELAAGEAC